MNKNLIPAGDYTAMIQRIEILPWKTAPHCALGLTMLIDEGPREGAALFRWIFFDANQPELSKEHFQRLGGRLSRVEEIDKAVPALIGNRLRVRLTYDHVGRAKPLILGYAGRAVCEQLKLGG